MEQTIALGAPHIQNATEDGWRVGWRDKRTIVGPDVGDVAANNNFILSEMC